MAKALGISPFAKRFHNWGATAEMAWAFGSMQLAKAAPLHMDFSSLFALPLGYQRISMDILSFLMVVIGCYICFF